MTGASATAAATSETRFTPSTVTACRTDSARQLGQAQGGGRERRQLLHPGEDQRGRDHSSTSSPCEVTVQRPEPTWRRAVRLFAPPTSSAVTMIPVFQNIFRITV